jgi:UDP-N-acetylglucosamine--N-acetylmuramyl-(pentapeptide) pyrophosphoryl-undecaprenol N-acetylglucosamine transferase
VIFATVGTHGQPFTRFLDALAGLEDDVVVQYGHNAPPAGVGEAVAFMPFDELNARMREADVVVTHAGVGSVLCAREAGHVPVVVPRLRRFGEHVDDHQLELVAALGKDGHVIPVTDISELPAAVQKAGRRADTTIAPKPLHAAVRAALLTP